MIGIDFGARLTVNSVVSFPFRFTVYNHLAPNRISSVGREVPNLMATPTHMDAEALVSNRPSFAVRVMAA